MRRTPPPAAYYVLGLPVCAVLASLGGVWLVAALGLFFSMLFTLYRASKRTAPDWSPYYSTPERIHPIKSGLRKFWPGSLSIPNFLQPFIATTLQPGLLIAVLLAPRGTIRRIVSENPSYLVLPIAALLGVSETLLWPLPDTTQLSEIETALLTYGLIGPVWGLLTLHLWSLLHQSSVKPCLIGLNPA